MSNFISLCQNTDNEEYIVLKKQSMATLLHVIELSGCKIAKTTWEKEMISYLESKKRMMLQKDNIGFDICHMPWRKHYFEAQKKFIFLVLEAVEKKTDWQMLQYQPKEAVLFLMLARMRCLFQKLTWHMVEQKMP